ncbi:multidrug resistance protein MdtN [compost metagenome]
MRIADIVGTENRFLLFCWCGALLLIVAFGFYLSSDPISVQGVAESREYQINFDSPVEIKHIYVLQNQVVKKGELLIELGQSEWESQLRVLKARQDKLIAEMKLRKQISQLAKDDVLLLPESDPMHMDLEDAKREIELIENRMKNLFVFAEVDGAVGAVNFKSGEKAPSFAPLMTLVPLNPTYVSAYINESLRSSIQVGQTVEVSASGGRPVLGKVVSVGSRIVPIPERLLRIQTLTAWGRELVIKIPKKNDFLLGEKVSVQKKWRFSFMMTQAQADQPGVSGDAIPSLPEEMEIPPAIQEVYEPEMSGIVFVPELKQFALVGDDYPHSRPVIFLMNEEGQIQDRVVPIEDIPEMDDVESISLVGDRMYLMSSLSATKKGKLKKSRQLFVKVKRTGFRFQAEKSVDLRTLLFKAFASSKDPLIQQIVEQGNGPEGFEVEGHTIVGEDLFLALKGPILQRNQSVILKIQSLNKIFEEVLEADDISVAQVLDLTLPHRDVEMVVTDLIADQGDLYLATSCRQQMCSAVWKLASGAESAALVHEFALHHLEGLAILPQTHQIYGVFDLKQGSQFSILPPAGGVQRSQ